MITVDCAVLGRRLNEARNEFKIPEHLDLPCLPPDCNWRDLVTDDDRLKFGEKRPPLGREAGIDLFVSIALILQ